MSRFILTTSLFALIAAGCDDQNRSPSQVLSQLSHRNKPVVSIVPMIDNTKGNYEWNIADELSCSLNERLSRLNHLQLVDVKQIRARIDELGGTSHPFSTDTSWLKKAFTKEDFIAFFELVKHEEVLEQTRKKSLDPSLCNAHLDLSVRVRVFDLRNDEPKVILQELIHDSHFIPRQFTQENFYQVPWGNESYSISPMGIAHEEFIKELAKRIDEYILMHK